MTAFEILLNKFYETIEHNEPTDSMPSKNIKTKELNKLIKKFIDTSFFHGHNLKYKSVLSDLLNQSAGILQNTNHEDWSRLKFTFIENDLHIIRHDREKTDIANLKMKLDRAF